VRREVKAERNDVITIVDHFKPGVAEFAALLPQSLADRLRHWDRGRIARGRDPFALPMKVRTDSAFGLLLLRLLAAMKGLRRRGSRFAEEQAMIEHWLTAIEAGARRSAALGFELAACGRLIKGYGATSERGKANLMHVIDHLAASPKFADDLQRAEAVRQARVAALADEGGIALDQTLARHGTPPIRWVGARPGRAGARAPDPAA
jgi:indolepyruvate ferredoxin oxidoreductase beta subunit